MAINGDNNEVRISGIESLLAPFHEACKPASAFRVGTEAEKFGWLTDLGAPLPFSGPRSVQAVLHALADRFGWTPEREQPEGEVIALRRSNASITLEPAGQLELSGSPLVSIHEAQREFQQHFAELHQISETLHIDWLSLGFHPFARHDQLPDVPKLRYGIMQRYLPTRGARALDMMRRTCTVQANLDYESEGDAMRKLRVGLALQPIATAMFANSPFYEGAPSGRQSERADVWLHMDPDRSGLLPFAWERDASFERYIEWALDVPMFLVKRDGAASENTHQTFRTFMREGHAGAHATQTDWTTHLNTLFPEVRLKNTIEMRGADALPKDLLCALPALWKGVMYDETALRRAEQLISPLSAELMQRLRPQLARHGLRTVLLDRPLQTWASELLEIATDGLQRIGLKNERGKSEAVYLDGIARLVHAGHNPATALLSQLRPGVELAPQVIEATRV